MRLPRAAQILGGLLLAAGALLRLRDYTQTPALNADEYDWAWSGMTLLRTGVPTGWTELWSAYGHWTRVDMGGASYWLVRPYLDHPPLFSLLVGGVSWLAGARSLSDVSLSTIRLVPIALGLLAIVLTFALVRSLLGTTAAFLTVALLALSSASVTLGRLAESESLLVIWMLIALLALERLERDAGNRWAKIALLVSCELAPLTKVPGIAVGLTCVALLVARRDVRMAIGAGIATAAGLLGYALYGAALDLNLFIRVWQAHAGLHGGFSAGYELLRGGLGDWWWVAGLVGLGAMALRGGRPARLLAWPAVIYVLVITMTANAGDAHDYDWYRIPIYPLVYAGAGFLLAQALYPLIRSTRKAPVRLRVAASLFLKAS